MSRSDSLCMPPDERIRVSRMRETCKSGLKRAGAAGNCSPATRLLDEPYLLTTARYLELNPVRAGLIKAPSRYRWSSAATHVRGRDDVLVRVAPMLKLAPNWRGFLARVIRQEDVELLRAHEHTGRPLGEEAFLATLEQNLG